MPLLRFWNLVKKSVTAWINDDAASMGAAIAYYTVFSLSPLLLIVIAVAGAVFGVDAVRGEVAIQLASIIGQDGARVVQDLIRSVNQPVDGALATLVSLFVLFIGATSVFTELQTALNRIWHVPKRVESSWWVLLRARFLSFGLILGLAFLLMVSLVISVALAAVGRWADDILPGWESILQFLNFTLSFGVTTVLFAIIYKFIPQARIAWRDVMLGAVVTAALFEVGKLLISLYIGKAGVASSYAAAGSIVVLLMWVYYSAQIFLLGAEFTWVQAQERAARKRK